MFPSYAKQKAFMSIEPFIKCSDINETMKFFTELLDFEAIQPPDPDPNAFLSMYAFLKREGSGLHLSQHAGDGVFGSVTYVRVKNLDALYETFLGNGLTVQDRAGISMEPVDQTWGMREFSVKDPDGNRITFGQNMA